MITVIRLAEGPWKSKGVPWGAQRERGGDERQRAENEGM